MNEKKIVIDKDLIKKVKSDNGNRSFSNKELLWYLVAKMDKIDNRLDNQVSICNRRFEAKIDKKFFYWIIGIFATLVFGALGLVYKTLLGGP